MYMNANKTCPNCNTTCSPRAKFCGNCGKALNADIDAQIQGISFIGPQKSPDQVQPEQAGESNAPLM